MEKRPMSNSFIVREDGNTLQTSATYYASTNPMFSHHQCEPCDAQILIYSGSPKVCPLCGAPV